MDAITSPLFFGAVRWLFGKGALTEYRGEVNEMHSHRHQHRHCEVRGAGCSFCPACGAKVADTDNYCGRCGKALQCSGGPT